ncbi:MAG: M1 family aminopeptidase [Clostridiaceae bacterium]
MREYILPFLKSILVALLQVIFYRILLLVFGNIFNSDDILISSISLIVSSVLVILLFLKASNKKLSSINLYFNRESMKIAVKAIFMGIIYSIGFLALILISRQGQISGIIENESVVIKLLKNLMIIFLGVLSTELIFRGYILNYLREKYSRYGAVLICSFIYALFRMFSVGTTAIVFLNYFLISVILCIIVLKYNNLIYAIMINFVWKFIFVGIFSLNNGMGIINLNYKNIELLSGGNIGFSGGLLFTLIAIGFIIIFILRNSEEYQDKISKKNIALISVIIVIAILGTSYDIYIWHAKPIESSSNTIKQVDKFEGVNNYYMDLSLDTEKNQLTGAETIDYINNSQDNLKEVYFHIYANAFSDIDGDISISKVYVDNSMVDYKIEGDDNTLLKIGFPKELKPLERVDIKLEYVIDIPERNTDAGIDRLAYGNNGYNFGNFFPIAAIYEDGKWDKHLYDKKGDAFYSETSNFEVNIKTNKRYTIASTGKIKNEEIQDNNRIYNIEANGVRDFAFVASDKFKMVETNFDGTIIKSYAYNKEKAEKILGISKDAISVYNNRFGEYPFSDLSVVETDLAGGMEYPQMVMIISDDYDNINFKSALSQILYNSPIGELEFTVVHELAHQWWYSLVGDDEFNEAWVDESITQFSSLLYYKDIYGEKEYNRVFDRSMGLSYYGLAASQILTNPNMERPLDEFDEMEYYALVYSKGPMMYKELYETIGDEKFNEFTRAMYDEYKYKNIKSEDLKNIAARVSGEDLTEFFHNWLETDYQGK